MSVHWVKCSMSDCRWIDSRTMLCHHPSTVLIQYSSKGLAMGCFELAPTYECPHCEDALTETYPGSDTRYPCSQCQPAPEGSKS